jgi:hypothetical protein
MPSYQSITRGRQEEGFLSFNLSFTMYSSDGNILSSPMLFPAPRRFFSRIYQFEKEIYPSPLSQLRGFLHCVSHFVKNSEG